MIIAINTRFLNKDKLEGIGGYTFEILRRWVKKHPEHQFYFIFDRAYSHDFIFADNVHPLICKPSTRFPLLITAFFQLSLPIVLKRIKADVFISMDGWIPCNINIPIINVIHDLNFEHHPEFISPFYRPHFKKWFPIYAQKSTKIIAVSQYTKADIQQTYGVDENKVEVVYNGVNERFQPFMPERVNEVRRIYADNCPYFIFVGRILPRKNLERTLEAFVAFKKHTHSNVKFLVVGSKSKHYRLNPQFKKSIQANDILFLGRQPFENLKDLLGGALALTYLSLYEGFGVPILEGFQAGVPVITSNITSMPEIAADAAITVNPYSIEDIKNAMVRVWEDENKRKELILKGLQRVKDFSWEESANQFGEIVEPFITQNR